MKLLYYIVPTVFLSILSFSHLHSQNTISLNTIASNLSSEPTWLTKVDNRMAWIRSVNNRNELFVHENGVTNMINTSSNFEIDVITVSETQIAWPAKNPNFTSGSCSNLTPHGFHYSNGSLLIDNVGCVNYVASNGVNMYRTYFDNGNKGDIVDSAFNVIYAIPTSYQGQALSPFEGTYGGDHLFFTGFLNSDLALFYLNVKTGSLKKIINASISYAKYTNDETLAFSMRDFVNNQTDIYYYDGNSTNLIVPDVAIFNQEIFTFKDRVVWATLDAKLIQYQNGIVDTLVNGDYIFGSLNVSDCYVTWGTNNLNANTSTLNLYDGVKIQTININKSRFANGFASNLTQIDNDCVVFVLKDLSNNTFDIIRADFAVSCCTGEDILTNTNDDEFSNTFIESTTLFTCNTTPVYQALDYIELNAGFTVPADYTFCAEIENACILYQE